jgi:negative regulator of flagellin synthesis FlgM
MAVTPDFSPYARSGPGRHEQRNRLDDRLSRTVISKHVYFREAKTMHVNGPSSIQGIQSLHGPHPTRAPHTPPRVAPAASDRLDISEAGQLASRLADIPEIRQDLVARVKSQIESGSYETPERLNAAVGRLLDEIG